MQQPSALDGNGTTALAASVFGGIGDGCGDSDFGRSVGCIGFLFISGLAAIDGMCVVTFDSGIGCVGFRRY